MSYFIFDGVLKSGKEFQLGNQEARHILKSRRLRIGERFLIQDLTGKRFDAVLIRCSRSKLTFVPEFSVEVPLPSALNLEILQAITKEKAINWILQKSTELGVNRLDFFFGKYSTTYFNNLKRISQLDRWNRIVLESSKQCGRQFPPEIFFHEDLQMAIKTIPKCQYSWLLSPGISQSASWKNLYEGENLKKHHRILVGPEGGFHGDEIDLALSSGMIPIYLGSRILRSETAAITAISILQFLYGDLN